MALTAKELARARELCKAGMLMSSALAQVVAERRTRKTEPSEAAKREDPHDAARKLGWKPARRQPGDGPFEVEFVEITP